MSAAAARKPTAKTTPRKAARPKPASAPQREDDRLVILNMKGRDEERAVLAQLSRETGVPLTVIARRGIALWMAKRKTKTQPLPDWVEG